MRRLPWALITPLLILLVAPPITQAGERGVRNARTTAHVGVQKGGNKPGRGSKSAGDVAVLRDGREVAKPRNEQSAKPRQASGSPSVRSEHDYRNGAWRSRHDAWNDRDGCVVVIQQYYGRGGLPPGLAKKQKLPPGLRKQMRQRGHLPPGLDKHWVALPLVLERDLPPLPPYYARRRVDNDLLVVDVRANVIVSLWPGIFGR